MSFSRYENDTTVRGGKILATNQALQNIRAGIQNGSISFTEVVLTESERLDIIAGRSYGDGRLWWLIAAASGIGWWLQAPAGTRIIVPTDLAEVQAVL